MADDKKKAKSGDTVKVDYTGSFDDGQVFDTSDGQAPLEFQIGQGHIIKGFDEAVTGMAVGEEKTVKIKPEDGYGLKIKELVQDIPLSQLKDHEKFQEGMLLTLKDPDGKMINAIIVKKDTEKITLDLNHPLAGRVLNFKIKLVSIGPSRKSHRR